MEKYKVAIHTLLETWPEVWKEDPLLVSEGGREVWDVKETHVLNMSVVYVSFQSWGIIFIFFMLMTSADRHHSAASTLQVFKLLVKSGRSTSVGKTGFDITCFFRQHLGCLGFRIL